MRLMSLFLPLSLLLLSISALADCWQGDFEPAAGSMVRAEGSAQILRGDDAADRLLFSEDFRMSSGVVLDLKICGTLAGIPEREVCLSLCELRKLKGAQEFAIPRRYGFEQYTRVRVFDLDLVTDHAGAALEHCPGSDRE